MYHRLFMKHIWFSAAGFCKAECIGILYLQRVRDAKRVYARIVNVRSNHDGSKPLFLSPHGPSQAKLLKMVYEEANIDVNSVAWIEAHATGTLVRIYFQFYQSVVFHIDNRFSCTNVGWR